MGLAFGWSPYTLQPFQTDIASFTKSDISPAILLNESSPASMSISTLLGHAKVFHQQLVSIRGVIKQPELHLDDTQLKEHFVFRLIEGDRFVTVFGIHDRTQGAPAISMDQQVEVIGIFYQERILNTYLLSNLVEAFTVRPYPPLEPEQT